MDTASSDAPQVESPDRERAARRMALLTLVGLVAAIVALYSWIQTRESSTPAAADAGQPLVFSESPPGHGEPAPDFSAEMFDGSTFSLADHLATDGRPVLLNLWASWCPPCRAEMPALDAAALRHPGVQFVGVAVRDRLGNAMAFAEEVDVSYPLGFDAFGSVEAAYPVLGMPATFLISESGVVLVRVIGQVSEDFLTAQIAAYLGG